MTWTYDAEADALYLRLATDPVAEQVELPDGTIVDVATSPVGSGGGGRRTNC